MKRLFIFIPLIALLISCQKFVPVVPDFESLADDQLIYPDVNLQMSSWKKLDSLSKTSLTDVSFYNENIGIVSGYFGIIFLTRDGGETWRTIETHKNMTFHCVYALDENTFFAARIGLFRSKNGGDTWVACNFPAEATIFEIWFKDTECGFLSSSLGTYRTTDAGDNWSKVSGVRASHLQFTSDNIGYFAWGSTAVTFESGSSETLPSYGDIYRTLDGGKTWKNMGLNVKEIKTLSFISDKTGFFSTIDGAFYKTSDGGESCNLIQNTGKYFKDLFFVNENQGYFCTGTGISLTLDGGYTLHEEYSKQGSGLVNQFEFPSPYVGYAIGNEGFIIKRIQ